MIDHFADIDQAGKDKILHTLRSRIRKGLRWEGDVIEEMAVEYVLPPEVMYEYGQRIYTKYYNEFDSINGAQLKKVEAFLSDKYSFKRNAITKRVLFRLIDKPEELYEPCRYNDIWRDLQHNLKEFGKRAKIPISDVQTLLESNYVEEFNPIKDYFERRNKWDGTDHIAALGSYIHTTDQDFWQEQLKKCLVRMIACSYHQVVNRIVMVLVQPLQESGKSNWLQFLTPLALKEYYKEDPITTTKDSEIAMTENFMWNMEELEALDRKEINSLKAFISRGTSKQRRAYARYEESRPRIVNFWGSTNKEQFLTDTQNARWLCFRVNHIDWDYNNYKTGVRKVDIDKVWDQAWQLYKDGFNYSLDKDEALKRDRINHSFESMGNEKQLIIKYLTKIPANSVAGEFNMVIDIVQYLQAATLYKLQIHAFNVQTALIQLGFVSEERSINGNKVKGFWVMKKTLMNGQTLPMVSEPVKDENSLPF